MWRAVKEDDILTYYCVKALEASHFGYMVRRAGGAVFASGMLLMAWNCWRTIRAGAAEIHPAHLKEYAS